MNFIIRLGETRNMESILRNCQKVRLASMFASSLRSLPIGINARVAPWIARLAGSKDLLGNSKQAKLVKILGEVEGYIIDLCLSSSTFSETYQIYSTLVRPIIWTKDLRNIETYPQNLQSILGIMILSMNFPMTEPGEQIYGRLTQVFLPRTITMSSPGGFLSYWPWKRLLILTSICGTTINLALGTTYMQTTEPVVFAKIEQPLLVGTRPNPLPCWQTRSNQYNKGTPPPGGWGA